MEDSSMWIHQHLYSVPVPSFSPLSLLVEQKYTLCFLSLNKANGVGGESYLAATHACTVKQFERVLLKPKWLDCL